jgi:hypothetical protein
MRAAACKNGTVLPRARPSTLAGTQQLIEGCCVQTHRGYRSDDGALARHRPQVLSDLPEHVHMRGVRGGYSRDARRPTIDIYRGMLHGAHVACGEENLVRQVASSLPSSFPPPQNAADARGGRTRTPWTRGEGASRPSAPRTVFPTREDDWWRPPPSSPEPPELPQNP